MGNLRIYIDKFTCGTMDVVIIYPNHQTQIQYTYSLSQPKLLFLDRDHILIFNLIRELLLSKRSFIEKNKRKIS